MTVNDFGSALRIASTRRGASARLTVQNRMWWTWSVYMPVACHSVTPTRIVS